MSVESETLQIICLCHFNKNKNEKNNQRRKAAKGEIPVAILPKGNSLFKNKVALYLYRRCQFSSSVNKTKQKPWQQKKIFLVLKITQLAKCDQDNGSGTFGFIEVQFTSNQTHPFQFHVDVQVPHVTPERQMRGHVRHPSKSPVPRLRRPPPEALGNRCPLPVSVLSILETK